MAKHAHIEPYIRTAAALDKIGLSKQADNVESLMRVAFAMKTGKPLFDNREEHRAYLDFLHDIKNLIASRGANERNASEQSFVLSEVDRYIELWSFMLEQDKNMRMAMPFSLRYASAAAPLTPEQLKLLDVLKPVFRNIWFNGIREAFAKTKMAIDDGEMNTILNPILKKYDKIAFENKAVNHRPELSEAMEIGLARAKVLADMDSERSPERILEVQTSGLNQLQTPEARKVTELLVSKELELMMRKAQNKNQIAADAIALINWFLSNDLDAQGVEEKARMIDMPQNATLPVKFFDSPAGLPVSQGIRWFDESEAAHLNDQSDPKNSILNAEPEEQVETPETEVAVAPENETAVTPETEVAVAPEAETTVPPAAKPARNRKGKTKANVEDTVLREYANAVAKAIIELMGTLNGENLTVLHSATNSIITADTTAKNYIAGFVAHESGQDSATILNRLNSLPDEAIATIGNLVSDALAAANKLQAIEPQDETSAPETETVSDEAIGDDGFKGDPTEPIVDAIDPSSPLDESMEEADVPPVEQNNTGTTDYLPGNAPDGDEISGDDNHELMLVEYARRIAANIRSLRKQNLPEEDIAQLEHDQQSIITGRTDARDSISRLIKTGDESEQELSERHDKISALSDDDVTTISQLVVKELGDTTEFTPTEEHAPGTEEYRPGHHDINPEFEEVPNYSDDEEIDLPPRLPGKIKYEQRIKYERREKLKRLTKWLAGLGLSAAAIWQIVSQLAPSGAARDAITPEYQAPSEYSQPITESRPQYTPPVQQPQVQAPVVQQPAPQEQPSVQPQVQEPIVPNRSKSWERYHRIGDPND